MLSQRVRRGTAMSSPQAVKDHLRLHLGVLKHEVFCVLFLDAQHRIIELLTQSLKAVLAMVDARVLDHFIVAGDKCVSFTERGLL